MAATQARPAPPGAGIKPLDDIELQRLYQWVDEIPMSRPKRNMARDFSDAVLVAEVVSHYFPKLVELHNYIASNSVAKKRENWSTFNRKIGKKMQFQLSAGEIEAVATCQPGAIEHILMILQDKMIQYKERLEMAKKSGATVVGGVIRNTEPQSYTVHNPKPISHAYGPPGGVTNRSGGTNSYRGPGAGAGGNGGHQTVRRVSQGPHHGSPSVHPRGSGEDVKRELAAQLRSRDEEIKVLNQTIHVLTQKVTTLESLVQSKDAKVRQLQAKIIK